MHISQFIDSIGIVTHIGSEPYNDPGQLAGMLDYLGIHNVRQNAPTNSQSLADMQALGQAGAKIDLIINGNGPVSLEGAWGDIEALKPWLNAIEAPNEVNLWPISYKGLDGIAAAIAFQADLYAAVRGDASLDGIPVYSFTLGGVLPGDVEGLIDLSPISDYANIHSYAPNGIQPNWVIPPSVEGMAPIASEKPVVLTETGYYTIPGHDGWGGVSESVQAKYSLNMLFSNLETGIERTYFYDLIDDGTDPQEREHHFGFFNYDGSAKQVATAFHNLTSILAEAGQGRAPADEAGETLDYSLTDMPWTASSMLLQAAEGVHVIAVWNQLGLWDAASGREIQHGTQTVTLWLGELAHSIRIFDPLLGTEAILALSDEDTVSFDLVDHPLLIEVVTEAAEPGQPGEWPALRELTLRVSEDAWQGDAEFIVTVNGVQQGGVLTTTALRAAGQAQEFRLSGHWGEGPLEVGVTFLNDAWGGSDDQDRNLYIENISLDGVAYAGTSAYLPNPVEASFVVGEPAMALPVAAGQLNLLVSGDAWLEQARIAVWVDGQRQGGDHTITAVEAEGETQVISIAGNWGAGPHDIQLQLLNDAWGGSEAEDVNAYLHGLSFDGQAYSEAMAWLLNPATYRFTVDTALI